MRRLIILLLTLSLFFATTPHSYGLSPSPSVLGKSAILIDAKTGRILYDKEIHLQLYPASTTKIMTAILAIEQLEMSEPVPIDSETPFTEGSRVFLLEGEQVTVQDVLYALLLESANDAAVALAKKIAGNVDDFSFLMNAKAKEVGALNTNFVNPNGLHENDHLSTAYDLAMIARYAMENPVFRDYVSTYQYTMEATNLQETRYLYNTNRLLYDNINKVVVDGILRGCKYEGVTGIKTGYTSNAGGCLVAGAKRGDTELIAVVLGSTDMGRFSDSITLLDYGFANYKTVNILSGGDDLGTIPVKRGAINRVPVVTAEGAYATLPIEASEHILRTELDLFASLSAPVEEGQKAGTLRIYAGEELLGEYDAITSVKVEEGGVLSIFGIDNQTSELIKKIIYSILLLALLFLFGYITIKRRKIKRKKLLKQQQKDLDRRRREKDRARWEEEYRKRQPY